MVKIPCLFLKLIFGKKSPIKIYKLIADQNPRKQTQTIQLIIFTQHNLLHTAIATNNPLMAFGSKLNQATITASDFNPEILNNPDRTTNFATKIEVLQPIINVDGLKTWHEQR
jgi:hypothetical protein